MNQLNQVNVNSIVCISVDKNKVNFFSGKDQSIN